MASSDAELLIYKVALRLLFGISYAPYCQITCRVYNYLLDVVVIILGLHGTRRVIRQCARCFIIIIIIGNNNISPTV